MFLKTKLFLLLSTILFFSSFAVQKKYQRTPWQPRTQKQLQNMNNIVMLFDFNRGVELQPFDITFHELLAVLKEKAFPVLVSDTIWNNFVRIRNLFAAKIQDPSSFEHAYFTFFTTLQERIKEEYKDTGITQFHDSRIYQELFSFKNEANPDIPNGASELTKQYIQLKKLSSRYDKKELMILQYSFICYTYLTAHEWHAYKYAILASNKKKTHEIILLVPKTYLETHPCGLQQNPLNALTLDDTEDFPLLFKPEITNREMIKKAFAQKPSAPEIYTLFSEIFTTKTAQNSELCPLPLPQWNIFITGHGTTLSDDDFATINYLANAIIDMKKQIANMPRPLANKKIPAAQLNQEIAEFEQKTKNFNASIKQYQARLVAQIRQSNNSIASIPIMSFQNGFLKFLSQGISTTFLCIVSCFAGGKNMSLLYEIPGFQRTYPFTIATADTTDTIATRLFFSSIDILSLNITIDQGNIVLFQSPANFMSFFDALSTTYTLLPKKEDDISTTESVVKPQSYKDILNLVYNFMSSYTNPGTIRYANTFFDHTIKTKQEKIVALTRLSVAQKYYEKQDINISTDTDAIVLYERNIPVLINLPLGREVSVPVFISHIPGKAIHYIQKLSAGNKLISTLLECFFHAKILEAEKVFVFDEIENVRIEKELFELEDNPQNIPISNVIIGHNMPNPFAREDLPPKVSGILCTYDDEAYSIFLDQGEPVKLGKLSANETVIYQKLFDNYKAEATKEPIMDIESVTKFMEKKPKHRPEYPPRGG